MLIFNYKSLEWSDEKQRGENEMENNLENTESTTDGFAALDTLATTFTVRYDLHPMDQPAPVPVAVEIIAEPNVQKAPKVDSRKGSRKVKNADGTVSYGVKADGTLRQKPGRKAKPVNAA